MRRVLILGALLGALLSPAKAADSTVAAMTAASALGGTELLYCVQGGADRKCTAAQMAAYVYGLMSGDATTSGGGAITFATVNANVGSFGGATQCTTITVNAKGLITAASQATCTPAFSSVTGRATLAQLPQGIANSIWINPTGSTADMQNVAVPACANDGSHALVYVNGSGLACATITTGGTGTVTSVTPGGGLVSGVTASCTQTAITGSGTLSEARCLNAQTGSTYTVLDSDRGKLVTLTNAAAIAVTLPQAGAASAFANGWASTFMNVGATVVTVTPTTSTINGASAYRIFPGQSVRIVSDGTNYQIDPGTTGGVTLSTQSGANYAIVAGDFGKLINLSNGSNQIPTLPNANTLGANWFVQVCNIGAGSQTITPSTSTIGGASTFVLPAASAARPACAGIVSDGTNYQVAPDFPMDASMFSAGTLAVARGGTGITSLGTGVATAMGNSVNTNGGLLTAATAAIASNAIVTGAGSGTPLTGTTPGTGVLTALGTNLSAAGGLSSTIASGTSALGTGAISSATCATVVTTAATNTATTDVIWWGFNGDPTGVTGYVPATAGMLTIIAYPSANNVNFKVCNNTSSSVTPGAITLNWRVIR